MTYTLDELLLAAYQVLRDEHPDELELSLRDKARRQVETLGDRAHVLIESRNRTRNDYLKRFAAELHERQRVERHERLVELTQSYRNAIGPNGATTHHNELWARAIGELQKSRADLFLDRAEEFRQAAYTRLRSERPWMLLDLTDASRETSIGTVGRAHAGTSTALRVVGGTTVAPPALRGAFTRGVTREAPRPSDSDRVAHEMTEYVLGRASTPDELVRELGAIGVAGPDELVQSLLCRPERERRDTLEYVLRALIFSDDDIAEWRQSRRTWHKAFSDRMGMSR